MGAVPDHPAMLACLELMISRLPGDTWQSGPGVLTDVLPGRPDVLLLPPGSFYPSTTATRTATRRMAEPRRGPWTFARHHYWGSWLEENGDGCRRERLLAASTKTTSGTASRRAAARLTPRTDTPGGRRHRAARGLAGRRSACIDVGCGEDWLDARPARVPRHRRGTRGDRRRAAQPPRPRRTWCGTPRSTDLPCADLVIVPRRHAAPDARRRAAAGRDGIGPAAAASAARLDVRRRRTSTSRPATPTAQPRGRAVQPAARAAAHPRRLRVPRRRPAARPRRRCSAFGGFDDLAAPT